MQSVSSLSVKFPLENESFKINCIENNNKIYFQLEDAIKILQDECGFLSMKDKIYKTQIQLYSHQKILADSINHNGKASIYVNDEGLNFVLNRLPIGSGKGKHVLTPKLKKLLEVTAIKPLSCMIIPPVLPPSIYNREAYKKKKNKYFRKPFSFNKTFIQPPNRSMLRHRKSYSKLKS